MVFILRDLRDLRNRLDRPPICPSRVAGERGEPPTRAEESAHFGVPPYPRTSAATGATGAALPPYIVRGDCPHPPRRPFLPFDIDFDFIDLDIRAFEDILRAI